MRPIKKGVANFALIWFVDDTDFKSEETGIAWNAAGMTADLSKNGGTDASFSITSGNWAEIGRGWYKVTLATGDVDTNGPLQLVVKADGILPYTEMLYVVDHDPDTTLEKINNATYGLAAVQANYFANATYGFEAIKNAIDAIDAETADIATILALLQNATYGLQAVQEDYFADATHGFAQIDTELDDIVNNGNYGLDTVTTNYFSHVDHGFAALLAAIEAIEAAIDILDPDSDTIGDDVRDIYDYLFGKKIWTPAGERMTAYRRDDATVLKYFYYDESATQEDVTPSDE